MRRPHKITLLILLPMLAAIIAIVVINFFQERELSEHQVALIESSMLDSKRAELKNYVELALTEIDSVYRSGRNDDAAKDEAKAILRRMNFGDDGYFFAYDFKGVNLVHPRLRQLEGQDLWDMRDPKGRLVIQKLIETADQGGGYYRYLWNKPSTNQNVDKLSYVVKLDRWGWMLGTGIYLDDVQKAIDEVRADGERRIHGTMFNMVGVATIALFLVFAGGLGLNISEHRILLNKLTALALRVVSSQEEERTRVARELHDGISQQLVSSKFHLEFARLKLTELNMTPLNMTAMNNGRDLNADDIIKSLEKGISGLSETISEVRRISHDLRSSLLDNLGLAAALEQLARDFSTQTGIAVCVDVTHCPAGLPETPTMTLFRIAQEGLTNISRHADAKTVYLQVEANDQNIVLTLVDDGSGFDVSATLSSHSSGIGLRNMRERAELQGGALYLRSNPGHTELIAVLPLQPKST